METPEPSPGTRLVDPPTGDSSITEHRDLDGADVAGDLPDPDTSDKLARIDAADDGSDAPVDPAVAPSVVAVVVTSDAGPWLETTIESLAAQEYPAFSVLVLDNCSVEDPTPRIAAAMPGAFVRRLERNVGFAAAANDAITLVEGATFLLFCHDDVALAPDAVAVMVEEAYRSNAGIVGPKFVDSAQPEVLLEVGMSIDHYGVPFSGIEPGEVDQEQHDAVRDVFYVSDATMLVRADLFRELGGFDPDTFPGSDDLDLCWRARLAGARVLVAPDARVAHRRVTVQDERPTRRNSVGDIRAFTRSRVRVLYKSYSGLALLWVLPTAFFLNVVEALALLLARRPGRARSLLSGWFAAFGRGTDVRKARGETQHLRRIDDGDVRDLMVRGSARVRTFVSYRLHAGDRLAEMSNRTRAAVSRAGSRLRALHVAAAIGLVFLIAFGSRTLIFDRIVSVGEFQDWPGAGSLWSTFTSAWRYTMMGAPTAATPAFGFMASWSTLLLGDTDLGRMFVIAGALPLGAFGAYRLVRPLAASALPGVTAAIAYAANPILRSAIAEGQLGPLVCFALAPFVLGALMRAATVDVDRRSRVHRALTVGLLTVIAGAVWPPAFAFAPLVAVVFVGSLPLVGGRTTATRSAIVAALGTVVATVLALPWFVSLLGADPATLAFFPRDPLSFAEVLAFDTGRAGSGYAAVGLIVAALLPLAVASGARLAWAARAWVLAIASFALAWLPARIDPSWPVPAPEGVLVPAALGLSLAAGLGVAAFIEDLRTFHFGWRQFAAFAAAIGVLLPVVGFAADSIEGDWGLPNDDWASRLAWMHEERDNGDFRVLWIGDATIMPTDAKVVDGVGYAITRQGPGDVRNVWAAPESDADEVVADAVDLVQSQRTVRFGHIVAPAGVRYVAFVEREAPDAGRRGRPMPAVDASLASQLDLAVSRVEPGATIYENQAWFAARAVTPIEIPVPQDSDDPALAAQRTDLAAVAAPVTGPRSDSTPAGPGTLLWAEAADGGWRASVGGDGTDRTDAFGWTNGYALDTEGPTDISYSGGARRILPFVELLLVIAAIVLWWRSRTRGAGERP